MAKLDCPECGSVKIKWGHLGDTMRCLKCGYEGTRDEFENATMESIEKAGHGFERLVESVKRGL